MRSSPGLALWRAFVIGVLAVATSGFGMAGLCGGFFTALGMANVFSGGPGQNGADAILVIAIPSLLIGAGVAIVCGLLLARRLRDIN